jgi:hypothetical protein
MIVAICRPVDAHIGTRCEATRMTAEEEIAEKRRQIAMAQPT